MATSESGSAVERGAARGRGVRTRRVHGFRTRGERDRIVAADPEPPGFLVVDAEVAPAGAVGPDEVVKQLAGVGCVGVARGRIRLVRLDAFADPPLLVYFLVSQGYKELNLIYYFTAGEKEVRCWTLYNGALAPQAAGVIHSDFERGFIKAETYNYAEWVANERDVAKVKEAGKYKTEGKEYVVKDGDIIFFKFNVTADAKKK